jgi:hypothetical protein
VLLLQREPGKAHTLTNIITNVCDWSFHIGTCSDTVSQVCTYTTIIYTVTLANTYMRPPPFYGVTKAR